MLQEKFRKAFMGVSATILMPAVTKCTDNCSKPRLLLPCHAATGMVLLVVVYFACIPPIVTT